VYHTFDVNLYLHNNNNNTKMKKKKKKKNTVNKTNMQMLTDAVLHISIVSCRRTIDHKVPFRNVESGSDVSFLKIVNLTPEVARQCRHSFNCCCQ